MIPLEYAQLEASDESKDLDTLRYTIIITLHKAYEDYCTVTTYKLASGKQEIQVRQLSKCMTFHWSLDVETRKPGFQP